MKSAARTTPSWERSIYWGAICAFLNLFVVVSGWILTIFKPGCRHEYVYPLAELSASFVLAAIVWVVMLGMNRPAGLWSRLIAAVMLLANLGLSYYMLVG